MATSPRPAAGNGACPSTSTTPSPSPAMQQQPPAPRLGQPRSGKDDEALRRLVRALEAEAAALVEERADWDRMWQGRPGLLEAMEELLEAGEGGDVELHPTSSMAPSIRLLSRVTRLSTPVFRPATRVQVPWSAPVVRALAQWMYTGRLVLPTALLAEVFQAAAQASIRPLVYALRTYPYYALRLTSADTASHIRRFALVAGSRRIAKLADDYLTHQAHHERNYTLICPVPLPWLRARPLLLLEGAGKGRVIVLAFDRRPKQVHESSPNLVLTLGDLVGRQPFEEPEAAEGEEGGGMGKGNGCLRLPTAGGVAADGTGEGDNGEEGSPRCCWSPEWFATAAPSSSSSCCTDEEARVPATGALTGDADGNVWLYVLCPRPHAGAVAKSLLTELHKAALLVEGKKAPTLQSQEETLVVQSEDSSEGGLRSTSTSPAPLWQQQQQHLFSPSPSSPSLPEQGANSSSSGHLSPSSPSSPSLLAPNPDHDTSSSSASTSIAFLSSSSSTTTAAAELLEQCRLQERLQAEEEEEEEEEEDEEEGGEEHGGSTWTLTAEEEEEGEDSRRSPSSHRRRRHCLKTRAGDVEGVLAFLDGIPPSSATLSLRATDPPPSLLAYALAQSQSDRLALDVGINALLLPRLSPAAVETIARHGHGTRTKQGGGRKGVAFLCPGEEDLFGGKEEGPFVVQRSCSAPLPARRSLDREGLSAGAGAGESLSCASASALPPKREMKWRPPPLELVFAAGVPSPEEKGEKQQVKRGEGVRSLPRHVPLRETRRIVFVHV